MLSKYGEILFPYVQNLLSITREAQEAIKTFQENELYRLEIGTTSRIGTYLLPRFLKAYKKSFPSVEITIETNSSDNILRKLNQETIHVGLISKFTEDTNFVKIPLLEDKIELLCSPKHPLYKTSLEKKIISLQEIEKYTIINFSSETSYYHPIVNLLHEYNIKPRENISVDNIEAIKRMASNMVGIAFLPSMAVQAELQSGSLVRIPFYQQETLISGTYLFYKKKTYINPAILQFAITVHYTLLKKGRKFIGVNENSIIP